MLTIRFAAPGAGYDPPLGQPGILTSQPEAGHLSFQRRLRVRDQTEQPLFDDVHGYGWFLLAYGNKSVESQLLDEDREFFLDGLKGQCVNISAEEDVSGEYRDWFADHMELDSVVLIRPDFYIFGHAPSAEVNGLVQDLRKKLGAA